MQHKHDNRHEHDCEECIWLGSTIGGKQRVDCYAHENPSGWVTLIARYSSEDSDYASADYPYNRPIGHAELYVASAMYEQLKSELERNSP